MQSPVNINSELVTLNNKRVSSLLLQFLDAALSELDCMAFLEGRISKTLSMFENLFVNYVIYKLFVILLGAID